MNTHSIRRVIRTPLRVDYADQLDRAHRWADVIGPIAVVVFFALLAWRLA